MKKSLIEYMNESKEISRWTVLKIGLLGGFCGALLAVGFMFAALA